MLTPKLSGHKIIALVDTWFLDMISPGKDDGPLSVYLALLNEQEEAVQAEAITFEEVKLPGGFVDNRNSFKKIK